MTTKDQAFKTLVGRVEQSPEYHLEMVAGTFADELYLAMESAGLNQAALARQAGVSRQFLNHVFRGKPNLTIKTLVKLAEAVGHKLHVHLAPAEVHCEWTHVIEKGKIPCTIALPDKSEELSYADVQRQERAHEELVIAA